MISLEGKYCAQSSSLRLVGRQLRASVGKFATAGQNRCLMQAYRAILHDMARDDFLNDAWNSVLQHQSTCQGGSSHIIAKQKAQLTGQLGVQNVFGLYMFLLLMVVLACARWQTKRASSTKQMRRRASKQYAKSATTEQELLNSALPLLQELQKKLQYTILPGSEDDLESKLPPTEREQGGEDGGQALTLRPQM
jgi:hypothetical protein